jgi:hypothetical protein
VSDGQFIKFPPPSDFFVTSSSTLGNIPFSVVMDTGSADLWVRADTPLPDSQSLGGPIRITYGTGSVIGLIKTIDVEFAGFNITNQVYIEAPSASITDIPEDGIIGLGPSAGSHIFATLAGMKNATPPVTRISGLNSSAPTYFTTMYAFHWTNLFTLT